VNKQAAFTLAPSIFLPFKGFTSGDAPALDQTQKLQKILQNLPEQQAVVRGNMMFMAEQRVEYLRTGAREELAKMGDYEDDLGDAEERKRIRSELDAMFQRAKAPANKDAKSEDFEVRPGEFKPPCNSNGIANHPPSNGDVPMGGFETDPKPRTARMVWEGLSRDLQEVVDRAASEMEAYDRHAQETIFPYKQALERRNASRYIPPPIATGVNSGILRNRNEESPVDMNAIRRMSTGMPIVGLPAAPPTRSYEKMDEIVRR